MTEQRSGRGLARLARLSALLGVVVIIVSIVYYNSTKQAGDGRYGAVDIPGHGVLHLPAGRIDLTFTEDLVNRTIDIPAFGLTVYAAAGGKDVHVNFHDGQPSGVNGVTHAYVGNVVILRPGRYVVQVSGRYAGLGQEIRFGRSRVHQSALRYGVPLGALLIVLGVALSVTLRRRRRREQPRLPRTIV